MQISLDSTKSVSGRPANTNSPTVSSISFSQILAQKIKGASNEEGFPHSSAKPSKEKSEEQLGTSQSESIISRKEEAIQIYKGKQAAKWLAQRFGMPLGLFMALLDQLGITVDQLVNPETRDAALNTLAEHFNLSEEEKKGLFEDFRGFLETLDKKIK